MCNNSFPTTTMMMIPQVPPRRRPGGGTSHSLDTDAIVAPTTLRTSATTRRGGCNDIESEHNDSHRPSFMLQEFRRRHIITEQDDHDALKVFRTVVAFIAVLSLVGKGTVSLHFKQVLIDSTVDKMHYTFAIGTTSELGYHVTRGCFEVIATPCGQEMSGGDSGENAVVQGTDVLSSSSSDIVDSSRAVFAVLAIVAAVLIGQ